MVVGKGRDGSVPFSDKTDFPQDVPDAVGLVGPDEQARVSARGDQHRGAFTLKIVVNVFSVQGGFNEGDVARVVGGKNLGHLYILHVPVF